MDCCFVEGNKRFRYRACAIIVEDGYVLFAKNSLDDYYYSIGGAVEFGETVEDAVKREVLEETGEHYEIDRLAFLHENFFTGSGTLDGLECHEIAVYFLMKPKGKKELKCTSTATCGAEENVCWLPIDKLKDYKAFPAFLAEKLKNLEGEFEHIVTRQNCMT
ncbi:MAG: NUDIX domain-containing protein [Clostridia bacterium]|nr:NUDIX domain-containing protein [Clostridia bacterium]